MLQNNKIVMWLNFLNCKSNHYAYSTEAYSTYIHSDSEAYVSEFMENFEEMFINEELYLEA